MNTTGPTGAIAQAVRSGSREWPALENAAMNVLIARHWQPGYVAVRRRTDLAAPTTGEALVVVAAARLGATRLIDNLELDTLA
jgi:pantoate--beta-alanine ligase